MALRVNADYESQLFYGRGAPAIINQSLEFLAFFLADEAVLTTKAYSDEYLDHVEKITGRRPTLARSGEARDWWGPLKDLEHERWMNSKVTSTRLNLAESWGRGIQIIEDAAQLRGIKVEGEFLLKEAFGMSGMGLKKINSGMEALASKKFPLILEPHLDRIHDFSHYVYPDGSRIAYENLVDMKFQYRGTLFRDQFDPSLRSLGFFRGVDWEGFDGALEKIIGHYSQRPLESGFSIDSFVHREDGKAKIHYLSEVNYRRTMGSTTYELAQRYANGPWCFFTLGKMEKNWRIVSMPGVLHLSPPDVRYQAFLLSAEDAKSGERLFTELRKSLPDCQFAVNV